jgi:hypothetical protein
MLDLLTSGGPFPLHEPSAKRRKKMLHHEKMKHLSETKSRAADPHTPAVQVASGAVVKKKAELHTM